MSAEACSRHDDVAAWVLGMVPAAEAQGFREHLDGCAACRANAESFQPAADALALSPAPETPAPDLKTRLLERTVAETSLFRAAEDPSAPAPRASRPRARIAAVAALAAVALLGAGTLLGRSLPEKDDPTAASTVVGMVTPAGGGPRASAAVTTRGPVSQLVLSDLGPPPRGQVYQAWVVRSDRTIPTGSLFSVPKSGDTRVSLPSLEGVRRVIVTAEAPQGSRTPTPPAVAVVVLPN